MIASRGLIHYFTEKYNIFYWFSPQPTRNSSSMRGGHYPRDFTVCRWLVDIPGRDMGHRDPHGAHYDCQIQEMRSISWRFCRFWGVTRHNFECCTKNRFSLYKMDRQGSRSWWVMSCFRCAKREFRFVSFAVLLATYLYYYSFYSSP